MSDPSWSDWGTEEWLGGLRAGTQEALDGLMALVYDRTYTLLKYKINLADPERFIGDAIEESRKRLLHAVQRGTTITYFKAFAETTIVRILFRIAKREQRERAQSEEALAILIAEAEASQQALIIDRDPLSQAEGHEVLKSRWAAGLPALRECLELLSRVDQRRIQVAAEVLNMQPAQSLRSVLLPLATTFAVDVGLLFRYCREADKGRAVRITLRSCIEAKGFLRP